MSPNNDSVLIEKPSIGKTANVPINETGTAINGISVARQPWRKMNTTMMTRTRASPGSNALAVATQLKARSRQYRLL